MTIHAPLESHPHISRDLITTHGHENRSIAHPLSDSELEALADVKLPTHPSVEEGVYDPLADLSQNEDDVVKANQSPYPAVELQNMHNVRDAEEAKRNKDRMKKIGLRATFWPPAAEEKTELELRQIM